MSRETTVSIMGLYNWDNTIFDLMQIPSGITKQTLITNLLAELAELEVLYPNAVVMKNLIGIWSNKQIGVWNKLYATTQYEYDPIENYNRYEEGTRASEGSTVHSGTDRHTIDRDSGGTDRTSETAQNNHFIAGFNSASSGSDDGLVKQTRDDATNSSSVTYGRTEDITDSLLHGEHVNTENEDSHSLHIHGNIGVMTTQQMIESEREIDRFNMYDIIIDDFKNRFCILIY